jgi:peptidoglycan/xylan/chitin deacetylase (PgdA/CDA1 family)
MGRLPFAPLAAALALAACAPLHPAESGAPTAAPPTRREAPPAPNAAVPPAATPAATPPATALPTPIPDARPATPDEASLAASQLSRQHRLQHLDTRLNVAPEVLHAQCRYESEIATAPPRGKVVLTFDDGPEPGQTDYILETLRKYHAPAAFFLVGHKVEQHPELVQRIRAEGVHLIGNHSWDHPNFHDITVPDQTQEVQRTRTVLEADGGTVWFRYPYGNATCETNDLAHQLGYHIVGWHIDSCDWAFDHAGTVDPKEAAICGVLPQHRADYVEHVLAAVRAHNGGIVLMHEIHPHTVRQLDAILRGLSEAGFGFTTLADPDYAPSLR